MGVNHKPKSILKKSNSNIEQGSITYVHSSFSSAISDRDPYSDEVFSDSISAISYPLDRSASAKHYSSHKLRGGDFFSSDKLNCDTLTNANVKKKTVLSSFDPSSFKDGVNTSCSSHNEYSSDSQSEKDNFSSNPAVRNHNRRHKNDANSIANHSSHKLATKSNSNKKYYNHFNTDQDEASDLLEEAFSIIDVSNQLDSSNSKTDRLEHESRLGIFKKTHHEV